jgi:hypothetical protein
MKTIISTFLLFFSLQSMADSLVCVNIDSQFEEDTLEFVGFGQETTAYYFDNDSNYSIACETTALDGYLCEDGNFSIQMSEGGYATVSNGLDPAVEFQCY